MSVVRNIHNNEEEMKHPSPGNYRVPYKRPLDTHIQSLPNPEYPACCLITIIQLLPSMLGTSNQLYTDSLGSTDIWKSLQHVRWKSKHTNQLKRVTQKKEVTYRKH